MMLQIISLLQDILIELKAIKAFLQAVYAPEVPVEEVLLDNSDATRLLKISAKTLYRWRREKRISSQMIGNKYYYNKSELLKVKKDI
jgi:DNA-binding transcriptional MerR regulator